MNQLIHQLTQQPKSGKIPKDWDNISNKKRQKDVDIRWTKKNGEKSKSRTRARVEHIFGFMEQSMNKLYLNTIGIKCQQAL